MSCATKADSLKKQKVASKAAFKDESASIEKSEEENVPVKSASDDDVAAGGDVDASGIFGQKREWAVNGAAAVL